VPQAEAQQQSADRTAEARMPEVYSWLLVPVQQDAQGRPDPAAAVTFEAIRLQGADSLAVRASKRLRHDDLLRKIATPRSSVLPPRRQGRWPGRGRSDPQRGAVVRLTDARAVVVRPRAPARHVLPSQWPDTAGTLSAPGTSGG